jgi:hypothetical protein
MGVKAGWRTHRGSFRGQYQIVDGSGAHDYVAMLYPLRAFILCLIIVALVARWEKKNKTIYSLVG